MRALPVLVVLVTAACAAPGPAPLDTRNDTCSWCRMAVSDGHFAAQLVVPGDDPRLFDDIGCLADYLRAMRDLPNGSLAYVADHRTKAWVEAGAAVYTRVKTLDTPMGSHLVAHADAASHDADPDARDGAPVSSGSVFGPSRLPRRTR
jgi:copper chaperone NosL